MKTLLVAFFVTCSICMSTARASDNSSNVSALISYVNVVENSGLLYVDYSPDIKSIPLVRVAGVRIENGVVTAKGFDAKGKYFELSAIEPISASTKLN